MSTLNEKLANACQKGLINDVQNLIDAKADIHYDYDYALAIASQSYHKDIVKLLLEQNADIEAIDDYFFLKYMDDYINNIGYLIELDKIKGIDLQDIRYFEYIKFSDYVDEIKTIITNVLNNNIYNIIILYI